MVDGTATIGASHRPLRDKVVDELRQRIIDGVYEPGDRLTEERLADDFGVSRNPVREAIRVLQGEGFLVAQPRRGAVVASLSEQDVVDLFDVRLSLEVLAAKLAAERAGTTGTAALDRLLVLMSSHRISLGIIPAMGERRIWVSAGFWIFDQGTVRVETPSAELTITQRGEIAVYEKRFARLQESAVYGDAARALIRGAEADFRDS